MRNPNNDITNPSNDTVEIECLIVLCKLSDGAVHSVNTDRNIELKIFDLINKEYNKIPLSVQRVPVEIIMPK